MKAQRRSARRMAVIDLKNGLWADEILIKNFHKEMIRKEFLSLHEVTLLLLGDDALTDLAVIEREVENNDLIQTACIEGLECYLPYIFTDKSSYNYQTVLTILYRELVRNNSFRAISRNIGTSGEPDPYTTTVNKADLIKWLESIHWKPPFFFPPEETQEQTPDYMNRSNNCFSPKLHAAISAWKAVSLDPKKINNDGKPINAKSVKQNIEEWLLNNLEKFPELKKDDGTIKETVIKNEICKVVNWDGDGGASRTPSRR